MTERQRRATEEAAVAAGLGVLVAICGIARCGPTISRA